VAEWAKLTHPVHWEACKVAGLRDEDIVERNPYFLEVFCHEFSMRFAPLQPSEVQKERNPALRLVAKIALNSLWGKFGQKAITKAHVTTKSPDVFYRHLQQEADGVIKDLEFDVFYDTAVIRYDKPLTAISDNRKCSLYLSIFTASNARVHLYNLLEKVGHLVMYYDTDSVYYIREALEANRGNEPTYGCLLGDFTDELKKPIVGEWFSLGPKTKIYTLQGNDAPCRPTCKGIPLTPDNCKKLCDNVKELVMDPGMSISFERGFVLDRNNTSAHIMERVGRQVYDEESDAMLLYKPTRRLKFIMDKRIPIRRFTPIYSDVSNRELIGYKLVLIDSLPFGYQYSYEEVSVVDLSQQLHSHYTPQDYMQQLIYQQQQEHKQQEFIEHQQQQQEQRELIDLTDDAWFTSRQEDYLLAAQPQLQYASGLEFEEQPLSAPYCFD
jgi:hypothetical protein